MFIFPHFSGEVCLCAKRASENSSVYSNLPSPLGIFERLGRHFDVLYSEHLQVIFPFGEDITLFWWGNSPCRRLEYAFEHIGCMCM